MQYKDYQGGVKLSRLGMGNMRLPVLDGKDAQIDYDKAKAIIDACMAAGVNYYDTAYIYHGGKSEEFVGKALADYPRDSYYVADKFNLMANPDYKAQFDEQLARLGMERIDFYLLHGLDDGQIDAVLSNGCIAYFDEQKKRGRLRYLGFSYHGSPEALPRLLAANKWDFVQIQLNYYDWVYGDAKALYELLDEAAIPVMVMEPVHGGLLSDMTGAPAELLQKAAPDRSLAAWAMRWVLGHDRVQVVLSGMNTLEQVADNAATFSAGQALTAEENALAEEAVRLLYTSVAIPCTSCRYCCPDCPAGLDIPMLLRAYSEAKIGGMWRLFGLKGLPEDKQPSACIGCGSCQSHCPQSFAIPGYMAEMRDFLAADGR